MLKEDTLLAFSPESPKCASLSELKNAFTERAVLPLLIQQSTRQHLKILCKKS